MGDFGLEPEEPHKPKTEFAADLLANIKPRNIPKPVIPISEGDEAAQRAGFTSREPSVRVAPYTRPTRVRRKLEQSYPLSMRTPVSILERFIAYAEAKKLSYPLALESLLNDSDDLARQTLKMGEGN